VQHKHALMGYAAPKRIRVAVIAINFAMDKLVKTITNVFLDIVMIDSVHQYGIAIQVHKTSYKIQINAMVDIVEMTMTVNH
jgi:hypothetical protein